MARIFTKYNFKFKTIIEAFIIIPMVLPPSVVGYGLLVVLGKNGPVGEFVHNLFEQTLIFTPQAACIACVVVALPMMYQSCKTAFLEIDTTYEDVAKDLGATDSKVFGK
ncbi:ABC transporter permease subunit [Paraclostridium benzoelyticum]|uniref:molybdate ABC transporter permease subunit n=1 Tax=Paraclostridium benzoelyticum TaxID=1629550 RepID=UPI0031CD99C8